ncbi:MAG: primosomal protein N' [Candidatus Aceula meridiana]|nr:primosomal protein N' [Candidatus Aceula meridiana]
MKKAIAQVVVGLPIEGPFDYSVPPNLVSQISVGSRVLVSFQTQKIIGFVIGLKSKSRYPQLKEVLSVLDPQPILSEDLLTLTQEFAKYYCCSWGEAIEASLPVAIYKRKKIIEMQLTPDIKKKESQEDNLLLCGRESEGVGSEISKRIGQTLDCKQGVLVLAPEVSLIPSYKKTLELTTKQEVLVLDKRLTSVQELNAWKKIREGKATFVLGSRSAVFAPVKNLGLIVILKEDNFSYKQEQTPLYDARHVALMRAELQKASIIFSSQIPTVERMHLALQKKISLQTISTKLQPSVQIIDLLNYKPKGAGSISLPLQYGIERVLEKREKVLLLMNKKGFGSFGVCSKCGHVLKCKRCDAHLTYLYHLKSVACRYCGYQAPKPQSCPECQSSYLNFKGGGIEKIESEAARFFPTTRIFCYDKETKKIPDRFDILVATQAVLHLCGHIKFSLSAVVAADAELNRLDFQAGYHAFALFQKIKNMTEKQLTIQTTLKDNYCIKSLQDKDPLEFYRQELKLRKELDLPPFKHIIEVRIRGVKQDIVQEQVEQFFNSLDEKNSSKNIEISEPQAAVIEKLRDKYRFVILVKGKSITQMTDLILRTKKEFRRKGKTIITVNVDP